MKTTVKIWNQRDSKWEIVEGKDLPTFWNACKFILHRDLNNPKLWMIAEHDTTAKICRAQVTQKMARVKALEVLNTQGYDKFKNAKRYITNKLQIQITESKPIHQDPAKLIKTPIATDVVLDMAKIAVLTTADFK